MLWNTLRLYSRGFIAIKDCLNSERSNERVKNLLLFPQNGGGCQDNRYHLTTPAHTPQAVVLAASPEYQADAPYSGSNIT